MSKPYTTNYSPSLKTAAKNYVYDPEQSQVALVCKNAIGEYSKIREYQEKKKNQHGLKPRIS